MIDSADDAVIGMDQRGTIVSWNPAAERLYGYSASEVTGKPLKLLVPDDRPDEIPRILDRIRRGERVPHFVTERRRKDGTRIAVSISISPVRDADGVVAGASIIARDDTRRAQMDEQLRESEATARAIIESAVDAIITIDEHGSIEAVNPATVRIFGYAAGELLGRNVSMLMPSPYTEEHDGYIGRYLETGERRVIGIGREVTGRRKDGSTFPMDLAVCEVHLAGRRLFSGTIRDISARKQLEEQLVQSQKMETVGRLAGGVAHDFNNLMTAVIGHAVLGAMELREDDPLRQDFDEIRATAERASTLTQQLLAFARRQIVEPKLVNLNELILNMHRMLGRLIGEDIELVTLPAADLRTVRVDPNQFEQVVVNLVVNARDAMPGGGRLIIETANVSLSDRMTSDAVNLPAGHYAMLAVTDSGTGMSEETKGHLFEPFYTTKEQGRGTGLGLATSYGVVRQAGGEIYVYSEPGNGTSMKIYLPHVGAQPDAPAAATPRTLPRGSELILLVEDEDAVRSIARRVLTTLGYSVVEARNGTEAVAALESHGRDFDIVITDMVMPEMGGVELSEALQRSGSAARVLLTSGYTDESTVRHGGREKGVAFLPKPYSPEMLANRVREILDGG
jgi:PAS domain S-box-containing protein